MEEGNDETVVVDDLRITAPKLTGHATVDACESAFLRQHVFFPEHNCAVHFRWTYILENVPEMRGRHLYDDLRDIYESVLTIPSQAKLMAVYDMTILQHRFWDVLMENNLTTTHVHGWQLCAAQAWQRRLFERLDRQKPYRRNAHGKIKKPVVRPPPKTGAWYH